MSPWEELCSLWSTTRKLGDLLHVARRRLDPCPGIGVEICEGPTGSPRARASHAAIPDSPRWRLTVAPATVAASTPLLVAAVLHELVHVDCSAGGDPEAGYRGHGPVFASRCNTVSERAGWRELVYPRGRGGLDCALWPYADGRSALARSAARRPARVEGRARELLVSTGRERGERVSADREVREARKELERVRVLARAALEEVSRDRARARRTGLKGGSRRTVLARCGAVEELARAVLGERPCRD